MVMFMKVIGLVTKQRALVFTPIWMELSTKASGKKINSMVRARSLGQMEQCMRVTM